MGDGQQSDTGPVPKGSGLFGRNETVLHASCVARAGRAVLITGASGCGKSALALQLIALGAQLVADDRTRLWQSDGRVMADVPPTIRGRIEARGVGILTTRTTGPAEVVLAVDLDQEEHERLPPDRDTMISGCSVPLLFGINAAHFASAILIRLDSSSRSAPR
ncbi:Hpr(Ser) kinase/phosphatase [Salinihabitans flavidus]|uniref:Hpr(Ser) kinase/phosphatase n=1 Tax=Salinihabitans flavidus TaxID=569882 RepID=A0A1H8T7M9_9RHOB|nr:hypothetical protein [Salinihabitans flavidus]SEO86911.1 Hpr(Ser) kinase/phosphatase [Salinihabitans flavidus]